VGKIQRKKVQIAGSSPIQYLQNPGGENYGGNVCDITNYTSSCSLEIAATQASATSGVSSTLNYNALGNIQRNYATGPGFADFDLSGEKETRIKESVAFTLRVDAFDILNHPSFSQPSGNVQSTAFGQITATRFAVSDGGSSRQLQISGKFTF
jgi:hypothetical protein